MSYESAIVFFMVFMIQAGTYLVTSVIHRRRHEKDEQAEFGMMFYSDDYMSGTIPL